MNCLDCTLITCAARTARRRSHGRQIGYGDQTSRLQHATNRNWLQSSQGRTRPPHPPALQRICMSLHRLVPRLGLAVGLLCACCAHAAAPAAHRLLRVTLDGASDQPVSGRLLVFATLAKDAQAAAQDGKDGKAGKVDEVDVSPFRPTA
ncbi:hypothetical protein XHC_4471, partial [Xanthomonas hortorum pv. carotae str. M081]